MPLGVEGEIEVGARCPGKVTVVTEVAFNGCFRRMRVSTSLRTVFFKNPYKSMEL